MQCKGRYKIVSSRTVLGRYKDRYSKVSVWDWSMQLQEQYQPGTSAVPCRYRGWYRTASVQDNAIQALGQVQSRAGTGQVKLSLVQTSHWSYTTYIHVYVHTYYSLIQCNFMCVCPGTGTVSYKMLPRWYKICKIYNHIVKREPDAFIG
jgi:hypothetical protein